MLNDFLVPFATIALAEMGDKTQLAIMSLAVKHRHTFQIFLGAISAALIADGSAVVLGSYILRYIPKTPVSIAAGAIFILFGAYSLLRKDKKEEQAEVTKKSAFITAFMLFFISEFGDKTQFSALLFGTQYNVLLTLLGVLAAMSLLISLALAAGKYLHGHLNGKTVRILSSALFIAIGLFTLAKALASA